MIDIHKIHCRYAAKPQVLGNLHVLSSYQGSANFEKDVTDHEQVRMSLFILVIV